MSKKNNFFEEDESTLENKTTIKASKETSIVSNVGEYYGKNVLYKYKDGSICRVVYDPKSKDCIERTMS
jgi:hypothetical protein